MTNFEIPSSRVVKITAKAALKNGLAEAVIAVSLGLFTALFSVLINSALSLIGEWSATIITVFNMAFTLFVSFPVFLGILRYFWRLTDGVRDSLKSVFYFFSSGLHYRKAIKLCFVVGWRIFTILFVSMLPFVMVSIISESQFYSLIGFEIPLWVPNLIIVKNLLYIIGLGCTILFVSRYYLVPVLVVMDEDLLLLEAVHISCMVSKRSVSSFFVLLLSLTLWIFASFLILPAVLTLPMILSAYTVHSRFAMVNYNLAIENSEDNTVVYYDDEK